MDWQESWKPRKCRKPRESGVQPRIPQTTGLEITEKQDNELSQGTIGVDCGKPTYQQHRFPSTP